LILPSFPKETKMTARLSRGSVALLALGAVLAGCSLTSQPTNAARKNQTAPEIVGTDQDGKEFRLSDYRGKVVLLDFWSST
jgi:cytochrome oxidase Cu insertion factor (SCO1/SenC/PrrC family)